MLYAFIHRTNKTLLQLKDAIDSEDLTDVVVAGSEVAMRKFKKDVLDEIGGFDEYRLGIISSRYGQTAKGIGICQKPPTP